MWDERYSTQEYVYGKLPNDFLLERYHSFRPGGAVLCLAEGEGRNAVFLAKKGFRVTGMDSSKVGKEKALELAKEHSVEIEYEVADLEKADLGEKKWDAIVSIFAHMPQSWRKDLHQRIFKALKPGGVLLLEGYSKEQLALGTGGPKDESLLYEMEEFENDLEEMNFEILVKTEREIQEGRFHSGRSSTIQLLARKR